MNERDFMPGEWKASELYGDFWLNSDPVPVTALRGNVILLNFWDYACSPSLHALAYVKEWHKRYRDHGLVVVCVHTPRFAFGRDPVNIQKAIERTGIEMPVVMDNGALIWSNYRARTWPTQILIDRNGNVRYQQEGEGNFPTTERMIQALLLDANPTEDLPELLAPLFDVDRPGAVCFRPTPELFAGYLRGSVGNVEGYSPESVVSYSDPKLYMENRFYVVGDWLNERESFLLPESRGTGGSVIIPYKALEVSGVFKPAGGNAVEVTIRQDENFLTPTEKGDDVQLGSNGRSYVMIDQPKLYSLVKNSVYGEHVLKLNIPGPGLEVYSFTFLTGIIPEMISNN
jgi:thiol-disulfide isomerase/thioredoxin